MGIIYFLWVSMFVLSSCKERPSTSVMLENPIDEECADGSFGPSRMELRTVGDELLPVMKKADGTYTPYQVDGMDQDGLWDELAFIYTLGGHEMVELLLDWMPAADYPVFERRANIRYGRMTSPEQVEELSSDTHGKQNPPHSADYPYQMDGLARENGKVGLRYYLDGRNCRDLSGKRVSEMVLDTVGLRADGCPDNTYQALREWGCDILSMANSFGLGGIAIQLQDALLRMGVE